jgi:hypothetical protein
MRLFVDAIQLALTLNFELAVSVAKSMSPLHPDIGRVWVKIAAALLQRSPPDISEALGLVKQHREYLTLYDVSIYST